MRISDWSSDVCSSDLGYYNAVITGGLPACAGFQSATTEGTFDSTYLSCDVPFAGGDAGPEAAAFAAGSNNSTGTSTLTGTFINGANEAAVPPYAGLAAVNASFVDVRSEEHTSELQSLMRISYAVFCLKKKNKSTP